MTIKKDDCGSKIIKILTNVSKPVDVGTFVEKLKVNKTTVYRQLEKLIKDQIVIEIEFGDGKKRYELKSLDHHHHLICKKCGKLEDVTVDESRIMKDLSSQSKFKIENHSLEFFGICESCI